MFMANVPASMGMAILIIVANTPALTSFDTPVLLTAQGGGFSLSPRQNRESGIEPNSLFLAWQTQLQQLPPGAVIPPGSHGAHSL
jgi:hypothetical protein